jgi:hypothetical protein
MAGSRLAEVESGGPQRTKELFLDLLDAVAIQDDVDVLGQTEADSALRTAASSATDTRRHEHLLGPVAHRPITTLVVLAASE